MAKKIKKAVTSPADQADFIKFLGTSGARFVMIKQLRASGGIWIRSQGANVLVDPGPGSIVRCAMSRPRLDPGTLDAVILTHRHLDHANDINVMIEAMTEGGFKKRGAVFCPADAVEQDSVILNHVRTLPERIEFLTERTAYSAGGFTFETSMRHIHPVETYGLKFSVQKTRVSLLTDTRYFPQLADFYDTDILIICVVLSEPRPGIDHLCLDDIEALLAKISPKKVILTHFGMSMLRVKPHLKALDLSKRLGTEVVAAYDGMTVGF